MNLEQGLQRLAELDEEFCKREEETGIYYMFYRDAWRKVTRIGTLDPDRIFAGVCAMISSKNWYWEKYKNKFWIMDSGTRVVVSSYPIAGNPAHAVVLTYVAALEGMREKCPECGGNKKLRMFQETDNGIQTIVQDCPECNNINNREEDCELCHGTGERRAGFDCIACNGTGKKQEANNE